MYLYTEIAQRATDDKPVRVGLIGAGKFGSMFLAQVPNSPGIEVAEIADLKPGKVRAALKDLGWNDARVNATRYSDDAGALIRADAFSGQVLEARRTR